MNALPPRLGRVLVVDDEVELMNVLEEALTAQGYETAGFTSAQAALEALGAQEFDLVLTDLMMPGMDGIALMKAGLAIDPYLVGVVMTGQGTVPTAVEAMKIGAFDYLLKPFRLDAILPLLARAMGVRRLRQENIQLRETVAIYNLSQVVAFSLDSGMIVDKTVEAVAQQVDGDEVSLMLVTPAGDELYVAAVRGAGREGLLGQRVPFQQGVAGWVARQSEPLILNGEVRDTRFAPIRPRADICSAISMPLLAAGKLVGVLNVNSLRQRRPFTMGQVKALSILTSTAASALHSAGLYAESERLRSYNTSIVETMAEGLTLEDAHGLITYANARLLKLLGYTADELIGQPWHKIVSRPEPALVDKKTLRNKPGQATTYASILVAKDGRELPVLVSATRFEPAGQGAGILTTFADLTERKQAEAALAESEERFRSWVENAMDLITVVDMQAIIQYESPSVERLLGYAPSELVGRSAFDLMHPDDRPRLLDLFTQSVQTTGAQAISEFRLKDREGAWREFEATGKTILDQHGQQVGLVYSRDISERKRAEEARERLVSIIEATPDFVGWTKPDGQVVYINRAGREMLGLGADEGISNTRLSDYVPAWANFMVGNEAIRTATATGQWRGESALLSRDGREIPMSQVMLAHRAPNGEVLYLSTIGHDISDRKQAETALHNYARQQAAVAEIGQHALTQTDLPALMDEAARLVAETLEVEFCEVMELAPGGETLHLRAGVGWKEGSIGAASVGAGTSSQAGFTLRSDGAVVSDDLSAETRFDVPTMLRDQGAASGMSVAIRRSDGVYGVLGVFTSRPGKFSPDDVHFLEAVAHVLGQAVERKQAEAALAASEAELRGLFAAMTDVVLVLDADGRYLQIAPTNPALLVKVPAELLGRTIHEVMPKVEADKIQEQIDLALHGREPLHIEYSLVVNGVPVWFAGTASPIGAGRVIWVTRDVTEQRQRERELQAIAAVIVALRIADSQAQMLPIVLEQVTALLNADATAVAMRDPATDELVVALGQGEMADLAGRRLPAGAGIAGQALATRQPYVTDDIATDPHFHQLKWLAEARAAACVPLITNRQVLGVLWAKRAAPFTEVEVRVLSAIGEIAASAMQRTGLHEQTEQRLQRLTALREIDSAIMNSLDLRTTLMILLGHVTGQLGVDASDILLLSRGMNELEYAAGHGFNSRAIEQARLSLGEGHAGQAVLERRLVAVPDLRLDPITFGRAALLAAESFVSMFCMPLIAKGQIVGVLEVFHRAPLNPDADWLSFLETLAGQAAIAVADARLFAELQRSNTEMLQAYDTTLEGWSAALDLRDKETEGHSQRVTKMTLQLARAMGVSESELEHMRRGALLHDIGKMGVPDAILLKPGKLTDDEWVTMRQHPRLAYELLSPIAYLRPALDIPYCHHEKWDGGGYPRKLKGDEIPLSARIFAVVDVWDALRSDRPYRPAWPKDKVRDYIRDQSGKHFDPMVVEAFLAQGPSE